MTFVAAIAAPAPARSLAPRRSGNPSRFTMDGADDAQAAAPAAPAMPVALHALLSLQESEGDAVQDRVAQRHAGSVLAALAELQRATLGGDAAALGAAVGRLDGLAGTCPAARDPRLAAVMRAVSLRAAIEMARRFPPT